MLSYISLDVADQMHVIILQTDNNIKVRQNRRYVKYVQIFIGVSYPTIYSLHRFHSPFHITTIRSRLYEHLWVEP